ncbi:unnamed protein product, partial [Discosporangium mesarthrocarpum]
VDLAANALAQHACEQVFDPLCAGFTDAAGPLRELTLKSMVAFTPLLGEKNLNVKLIKHLCRLQVC